MAAVTSLADAHVAAGMCEGNLKSFGFIYFS